jgi:hypothetical protein
MKDKLNTRTGRTGAVVVIGASALGLSGCSSGNAEATPATPETSTSQTVDLVDGPLSPEAPADDNEQENGAENREEIKSLTLVLNERIAAGDIAGAQALVELQPIQNPEQANPEAVELTEKTFGIIIPAIADVGWLYDENGEVTSEEVNQLYQEHWDLQIPSGEEGYSSTDYVSGKLNGRLQETRTALLNAAFGYPDINGFPGDGALVGKVLEPIEAHTNNTARLIQNLTVYPDNKDFSKEIINDLTAFSGELEVTGTTPDTEGAITYGIATELSISGGITNKPFEHAINYASERDRAVADHMHSASFPYTLDRANYSGRALLQFGSDGKAYFTPAA